MKKINVRVLAEIAIFAAIGFVLDVLQGGIWKSAFPNGGSIGFAMIPVFIICYRRGLIPGLLCGLILSIVQMLGGIYVINSGSMEGWKSTAGPFVQVMLDYVLGYTVCGFAGCFAGLYHNSNTRGKKVLWIVVGCVVGSLLKYAAHVASGCFFWPGEMWGVSGYAYSFLYNGLYCIPNMIICTAIMVLIAVFYPLFINAEDKAMADNNDVVFEDVENEEVNK